MAHVVKYREQNHAECHGWSSVWCAGCGTVAPCARQDCPSCGEHPELLKEAQDRRARKVEWAKTDKLVVNFTSLPKRPYHI